MVVKLNKYISYLKSIDRLRLNDSVRTNWSNPTQIPKVVLVKDKYNDQHARDVVLQASLDGTLDAKESYEKITDWDTPCKHVSNVIDRAISEGLLDEKEASKKVSWDFDGETGLDNYLDGIVKESRKEITKDYSNQIVEKTAIVKRPKRKGFFSRIGNKIAAGVAVVAAVAGISYSAMEKNDYHEKPNITMQENVYKTIPKSEPLESIAGLIESDKELDRKDQIYNLLFDSYDKGKGESKFSKYNVQGFMLNQNVINIILKDWFKSPKAYTVYTNANDYAKAEFGINLHNLTKKRGEVFDSEKDINL